MNTTTSRYATEKQIEFLKSLLTQIAELGDDAREHAHRAWLTLRKIEKEEGLTKDLASKQIESLKGSLEVWRRETPRKRDFEHSVPSGRYAVDTDEGHTGFYRVAVKDSGHTFVEVQASDVTYSLPWNAAKGVLRKIEDAGVEQAGVRYGLEIGRCYKCGRTLTDETSRAQGIGPDCAKK